MRKRILLLLFLAVVASCKIGPEPIAYGSDGCHFCRMTIVDKQHAAELVTDKGKVYKFDAVECMLNMLREFDQEKVGILLVNDYASPGILTDATQATFLISENIPSPMGAFLSAFGTEAKARKVQEQYGGALLSWQILYDRYKKPRTNASL
jgi:copper chaperone NosL